MAPVSVLSIHAGYGCRQRGACCAAGWPVPVEADCADRLEEAVRRGRLTTRVAGAPIERPPQPPIDLPGLLARPDGVCTFFDGNARPSCRVHASLGHQALPLACRQFPRVTVHDPRGVSVTLSHYCPTAAAMLEAAPPVAVIHGAPGFPEDGEYVGLDARDGLPPLLRPDMAMDWESWWAWERVSVDILAREGESVDASLALLRGSVETVRSWRPESGHLADRVTRAPATALALPDTAAPGELVAELLDTVPRDLAAPRRADAASQTTSHAHRRFLAAHAFANWTAYLGLDLRAWLRSVETADALLRAGYSVREADLLLRHLADPFELARRWSAAVTSRP